MSENTRERLLMDHGWRFHPGDILVPPSLTHSDAYASGWAKTGVFRGAASPDFDDSEWRLLDLPHDWVVEGEFSPQASGPRGYYSGGVAWYRKTFFLSAADKGRKLFLEFEGIFRDATVYLNGHRLGHEPSGYVGHVYDISDQSFFNDDNVLAVRVDSSENEGWWYEGGGIYRHVWLTKSAPVFFPPCGIFVSADPDSGKHSASVLIQSTISNDLEELVDGELLSFISGPDGNPLAETRSPFSIGAGEDLTVAQNLELACPRLWSPDDPALHISRSVILINGEAVDEERVTFGVRSIRFDPDRGFFLNGKSLKILGVSNHEDHAGVGMAVPDRLFEFRISRLKEMGANAWRCAHNPPAPAFLDACDRLGMMVMDETRCMNSTLDGRRQLEHMIRRDRNHPSVIMWSLGNEEGEYQGNDNGREIIRHMRRWVRRLDPTRQVTLAMSSYWGEPVSPVLDVQGCNYNHESFDDYHKRYPAHPMLSSEDFSSSWKTRGEYENAEPLGLFSSYDKFPIRPDCTADSVWGAVAERKFVAGTFPWTGFDYRGEPSPAGWPCVGSNFGILDTCGFPKDIFFFYQAWWSTQTVLHLFPHWNWLGREGQIVPVWCYSNCGEVELFVNGKSLGRRSMKPNGHIEWDAVYSPGSLCARGYVDGAPVAEKIVETTGTPYSLSLIPGKKMISADGEDLAIITVAVLDNAGRTVPLADNEISFSIDGSAAFLGVGNGNPASHESDKIPRRRAFHGLCQLILQAGREPGKTVVHARSGGLRPACLEIMAERGTLRPALPAATPSERIDLTISRGAKVLKNAVVPPHGWNNFDFVEIGWEQLQLKLKCVLPSPSIVRIRFMAPSDMPSVGLEADLGAIHDYDESWLNGSSLGSVHPGNSDPESAYRVRRRYVIPEGLLRPGEENVLAVRVWNRKFPNAVVQDKLVIRKR
ncbi:MAG: beta-galactosidase GalA [Victivallales bacterium]